MPDTTLLPHTTDLASLSHLKWNANNAHHTSDLENEEIDTKHINPTYLSYLNLSLSILLLTLSMFISILPLQNLHLRAFITCSSAAQPWH